MRTKSRALDLLLLIYCVTVLQTDKMSRQCGVALRDGTKSGWGGGGAGRLRKTKLIIIGVVAVEGGAEGVPEKLLG